MFFPAEVIWPGKWDSRSDVTALNHTSVGTADQPRLQGYFYRTYNSWTIRHLFPDAETSLVAGILTGSESHPPLDDRQAFNNTSTSQIVVTKGSNRR